VVPVRQERFHTPGQLTVAVRLPGGSVEIETVDGEDTEVELEPVNDAGREAVESATIAHRQRGEGAEVVVEIEERRRILIGRIPRARLRLRCPHGARLELVTVSADVDARGRFRSTELKTVSGDLRLGAVEGDARLKSVSGDLTIETVGGRLTAQTVSGDLEVAEVAGPAETRTVSGDVRIEGAHAGVAAQTVSGDQEFRAVSEGTVRLKSVSGDLLVGIARGSRVWVDASTVSGSTRSELDLGDAPPGDDDEGPVVEVRARAMSGDIRIVRA
jgi:hypothetical protein